MALQGSLHSIGRLTLIFLCLGSVLFLALLLLPIYLDVTALKGPIEELLTEIIEAPVTVDEVELNPSLWPTLRLSQIEVEGTGWEEAPVFTAIERAELRLSLLPLFWRDLHIKRFSATDLDVHLSRPEGQEGNWPVWTDSRWQVSELAGIQLQDVTIFLDDQDIGQADAFLDSLEGDITRARPLELELRGTLEGLPLSLNVGGPTLIAFSKLASDVPVAAHLELSDLRLNLSGTVSREPAGTKMRLEIEAASPNWAFLEQLEGFDAPEIGGFDIVSRISLRDSMVELSQLQGTIGPTIIQGALSLQRGNDRPRISGRIALGDIDLEPWIERAQSEKADTSTPLPLALLSNLDAELVITVESVAGTVLRLEDLEATAGLAAGDLTLPLELQIAAIPVAGELWIRQSEAPPEVTAQFHLQGTDLAELRKLIAVPEALTGGADQIQVVASSFGHSVDALANNLDIQIEIHDARVTALDETGEVALDVAIAETRIHHRPGEPLILSAAGEYLAEPFRLDLETAPADSLLGAQTWPFRVGLRGSGADIDLVGTLSNPETQSRLDLDFLASGRRLGDLDAWLGLSADSDLAYRLAGHLSTQGSRRSLRLDDAEIGRTRFQGAFDWDADRMEVPVVADLRVSTLDLQQLQQLADPVTTLDTEEEVIGFDLPMLPSEVLFDEAELRLAIDRIYRQPIDLTDLRATLHFRQGQLERSAFALEYAGTELEGELALDLRGQLPRFTLDLAGSAKALDVALDQEDLITDARVAADQFEFSIASEGVSIHDLVEGADISGQLTNVRWRFSLPGVENSLELRLGELDLSGARGQPLVLESAGSLGGEPLRFRLTFRNLRKPPGGTGLLAPFHLQAMAASNTIDLAGEIQLPITQPEFDLQLAVSGESLADLSALVGYDLPALGTYHLEGRLVATESLVGLYDFTFTLGESDLSGSLESRQIDGRTTIEASMLSKRTRSADYLLWLARSDSEGTKASERPLAGLDSTNLSLDFLTEVDAAITLVIDALDSGSSSLEHLSLTFELDNGQLDLLAQGPQTSGDPAQISARVTPLERGIAANLDISWERQPYGLLGDILKPGAAQGSWSLDLALQTRGDTVDELLRNLAGHVDFTDYPEDFGATILDVWGGGFIGSLMPVFKIGEESRINCTVGRFLVDGGIMTPELLALDSTRSRVRMRGTIDLPNNTLELRLQPRPKKPSLINLATPVKLRGALTDPKIQIATGGTAVTAFRLYLWVYTVWLELLRKPLPTDGRDICLDPQPRTP